MALRQMQSSKRIIALIIVALIVAFVLWQWQFSTTSTTPNEPQQDLTSFEIIPVTNNLKDQQQFETLTAEIESDTIIEDKSLPTASVAGKWKMLFQNQQGSTNNMVLELDQNQGLVEGKFGNTPITALVQGNTFRFTFRIRNEAGDLRIRHRGAVTHDENLMKGSFSIERGGDSLDTGSWVATRI